ncbi:hypothetical protein [Acidithiobacillus sulfuriphilus]|uniref:hypothetical protein n=1 Tax=Acidithiobacillus sulfuriphilus TaxID=1867749 RepID=UPI003F5F2516
MRIPPLEIKQYGNVLKIIITIPWDEIHTPSHPRPPEPPRPQPDPQHWQKLTAKVGKAHQQHGNISATAKALDLTYYTTQVILREEKTRENRKKRQAQIEQAKNMAQKKTPVEDIARIFGKSPATIRRWMSGN